MKSVLTDSKLLLKFTILSVIESLRTNPGLCYFILYDNPNNTAISYGPNYPSLMSSGQQQQQLFNDSYTALILEEAEKLYNKLRMALTNMVMTTTTAAATTIRESWLPSDNNREILTHKSDIYRTEEQ